MITIVAKCILREGIKNEFISSVKELIDHSRNEPGNIAYDLYECREDNNTVSFIEKWEDESAIEKHNSSSHFRSGLEILKKMSESIEITSYLQII